MARGMIFDIERYAIHDGPGIRTTVYFKGCPLRCVWCHNPEGLEPQPELVFWPDRCIGCGDCLEACPHKAITRSDDSPTVDPNKCELAGRCAEVCPSGAWEIIGRTVTADEVMREVGKDAVFYEQSGGGVTFSGGEPLMQPEFLSELLGRCKETGIHTALDTSGCAAWNVIEEMLADVDLFLYDLKAIDDEKHKQFTGVSNEFVLGNLRRLASEGANIVVRVPIVPGMNDHDEAVSGMGEFVASLRSCEEVHILPYHRAGVDKYERLGRPYNMPDVHLLASERVAEIAQGFRKRGFRVKIGG